MTLGAYAGDLAHVTLLAGNRRMLLRSCKCWLPSQSLLLDAKALNGEYLAGLSPTAGAELMASLLEQLVAKDEEIAQRDPGEERRGRGQASATQVQECEGEAPDVLDRAVPGLEVRGAHRGDELRAAPFVRGDGCCG